MSTGEGPGGAIDFGLREDWINLYNERLNRSQALDQLILTSEGLIKAFTSKTSAHLK